MFVLVLGLSASQILRVCGVCRVPTPGLALRFPSSLGICWFSWRASRRLFRYHLAGPALWWTRPSVVVLLTVHVVFSVKTFPSDHPLPGVMRGSFDIFWTLSHAGCHGRWLLSARRTPVPLPSIFLSPTRSVWFGAGVCLSSTLGLSGNYLPRNLLVPLTFPRRWPMHLMLLPGSAPHGFTPRH
jgi:hypothetical protein